MCPHNEAENYCLQTLITMRSFAWHEKTQGSTQHVQVSCNKCLWLKTTDLILWDYSVVG